MSTEERRIGVFFYGSYMNLRVLADVGLRPQRHEVACLRGFDIRIAPLANVVRSERHTVYGILTAATHAELDRLYAHAREVLGGVYLPEAVIVECRDGALRPAVCYIALSWIGNFSEVWVFTAVLLAALPTATNVFVIAQQYDVWVQRASASILLTTVLSVGTVTALLYLIKTGMLPPDLFP